MKVTKRKISEINNDFNKSEFISPSQLKNYILRDPLIDYLEYYKINNLNELPNRSRSNSIVDGEFVEFIKLKGIDFENKIINEYKYPIYKVNDSISINSYNETVNALKDGKPIIYQGVLIDFKNKTFGRPDIIIRGDFLKLIYNIDAKNDLYYIIDIKYSTIQLSSDQNYILNSDLIPFYKGQIFVYTNMLNNILNQNVKKSFILGKKYIFTKNNIKNIIDNSNFDKLALVDYEHKDLEYPLMVEKAITWVKKVRSEGHNWVLLPKPSVYELYPNMSTNKDSKWNPLKKEIAEEIKELTLILNVGYKERTKAFSQNIFSYEDSRCNSDIFGFKGNTAKIVDNIININSPTCKDIISPTKIKDNSWRKVKDNQFEFFIDYETTDDFENNSFIFMIGVGCIIDNKWKFGCFISENSNIDSQKNMFDNFWSHVNKIADGKEAIFIHWTHAEPVFYEKMRKKIPTLPNKNFLDLYKIFMNEPISIKGALNYSLKTIAKVMYKHNLIKTSWASDTTCSNGLDALIQAHKIYFDKKNVDAKLNCESSENIQDITKYNEVDCKVLYEIIDYLRKNH